MMIPQEKLARQLTGVTDEQGSRRQILTALLQAFEKGGDAAAELLKQKMKEMEDRFDGRLAALEEKF